MPSASEGAVYYEAGQTLVSMVALTDDGDHKVFNSAATMWSKRSGYVADVRPNGVLSGGAITPADSGTNDLIDVAALRCWLNGSAGSDYTSVTATTDLSCTRGTGSSTAYIINSVTVDSSGAFAVVVGTGSTAFSTTRDAAGGPPLIPTTSIEVGQVRFTSASAAAVTASEIFQVPNTHKEMALNPTWTLETIRVSDGVIGYAGVTFVSALPLIHTGAGPKKVYAEYYTPDFAEVPIARNFVMPQESYSVTSEDYYQQALGSTSRTLNQGSFEIAPNADGISDSIFLLAGELLWFKFFQDAASDYYIACQGKMGESTSFPADTNITTNITISAENKGYRILG